jgi:uncharacterized protein (TIGR02271 family)
LTRHSSVIEASVGGRPSHIGRRRDSSTSTHTAELSRSWSAPAPGLCLPRPGRRVGTATEPVGRARLRKYVVTKQVQQTVPVSHEEVRVEREPITDANVGQAMTGPEITEAEHEVTLHQERPVVEKEAVPVERVRLAKETVSGEVRKERIETDTEGDTGTIR